MPVSQELLSKISEYEKQGETPDRIVRGLAQSKNYPDVANKIQGYLSQNETPERILQGLKSSGITEIPHAVPKSVTDFLFNRLPKNVVDIGKGMYQTVRHPFQTAENIGGLGGTLGRAGLEKITGEQLDPEARATVEAIKQKVKPFVQDPGHALLNYAYEKPVDVAMMVSPTIGLAGKGAELAGLPRAANVLRKTSEWVNPVTAASKAIPPVTKALTRVGKETVGALTGGGPGFIEEAAKGGEMFQKAMRGQISSEEIVETARDALGSIREKRGMDYRSRLAALEKSTKQIDMSPIQNDIRKVMSEHKITINPDDFTVDTSRAGMSREGRNKISEIINEVWTWDDKTPSGLDRLRKRLDDFYSDSSQARAIVTQVRNSVNRTITKAVPEYEVMTKGYKQASDLIKDIELNLGMGSKATADSTLKRLTSALRENSEIRKDLMDVLGEKGAEDVSGAVAGHVANQLLPRGLSKWTLPGEAVLFHYLNPHFYPVLAASSPRLVGEFLHVYGWALEKLGRLPERVGKAAKFAASPAGVTPIYGASKVNQLREETQPRNALAGE